MTRSAAFSIFSVAVLVGCGVQSEMPPFEVPEPGGRASELRVDSAQLIRDIRVLSADSMEGRRTGTSGNARARAYLLQRVQEVGLTRFGESYAQPFSFVGGDGVTYHGTNLVGFVLGTEHPEHFVVLTAHYDHLGVRGGDIYHGADDNASGTAALLALAQDFVERAPRHTVVFAWTDAEEGSVLGGIGLQGARAFVASPPVPLRRIVANVNLDMVSRNDRDELYVAGTYHTPALLPLVERLAEGAEVRVLTGHDRPDLPPGDDWTLLSDHGVFHEAGIPFVYFGVEDHADYHRPTDTFENIQPGFYLRAVRTILDFVRELDGWLEGQRAGAGAQASISSNNLAPSLAVLPSGS